MLVVCGGGILQLVHVPPLSSYCGPEGERSALKLEVEKSSVTSVQEACSDLALYTKGLCGDLSRFLLGSNLFYLLHFGLVAFT